jgi:hypothetical protein
MWSRFRYFGNQVRIIIKIFRNTNIKPAYAVNNFLRKNLAIEQAEDGEYTQNETCELKRDKYNKGYMGQNRINFKAKYKEQVHDI